MDSPQKDLTHLLAELRETNIDAAVHALERRGLPHYPAADPALNRQRLSALYDVVAEALAARSLDPMRAHARAVAHERFQGGIGLQEVHAAFNVLEEVLWRLVTARLQPEQYPEALGLVSTVLGAGKQELAVQYVALADPQSRFASLDLSALFRGTV